MVIDRTEMKRISLAFAAAAGILAVAPDLKDPRAYLQAGITFVGTYWRASARRPRRKKEDKSAQAPDRP